MLHLGGARQPACQASGRGIAGQDLALRGPGGRPPDPETAGRARSSEEIPVKGVPHQREIARGEPQRSAGSPEARSSPIVPALLERLDGILHRKPSRRSAPAPGGRHNARDGALQMRSTRRSATSRARSPEQYRKLGPDHRRRTLPRQLRLGDTTGATSDATP